VACYNRRLMLEHQMAGLNYFWQAATKSRTCSQRSAFGCCAALLMRCLCLLALALPVLGALPAHAQSCPYSLVITKTDGSKDCFTNLPIANEVDPQYKEVLSKIVGKASRYFLAYSKSPACKAVAVTSNWVMLSGFDLNAKAQALSNCQSQGCDCEVAIDSGKVLSRSVEGPDVAVALKLADEARNRAADEARRAQDQRASQDLTLAAERLKAEAGTARRQQAEAEEKLRLSSIAALQRQRELEEQLKQAQLQVIPAPVVLQQPAVPARAIIAHALIIGNAAYPSKKLDNPVNDARAMTAKLRGFGFVVTQVLDAGREKLTSVLAQWSRTAANADLTVLFYAGHAIQVFGKNYMLPIDIDQADVTKLTLQGVAVDAIIEQFMPGKTKLVFLDACRTNPLAVRTASRGITKGLAPITVGEGTLIAYAAKDGQEAEDGTGQRNSPFTTALLEHLNDPDDIAVVLRKVREKVMKATSGKQQPWEYGSLTGGALVLSAMKYAK